MKRLLMPALALTTLKKIAFTLLWGVRIRFGQFSSDGVGGTGSDWGTCQP